MYKARSVFSKESKIRQVFSVEVEQHVERLVSGTQVLRDGGRQ